MPPGFTGVGAGQWTDPLPAPVPPDPGGCDAWIADPFNTGSHYPPECEDYLEPIHGPSPGWRFAVNTYTPDHSHISTWFCNYANPPSPHANETDWNTGEWDPNDEAAAGQGPPPYGGGA